MPGEFYFMALGGLGVSLAGFAGLIAALDRRAEFDAIQRWRLSNIVIGGFTVTLFGFGTIAVFLITDDVQLTARVSSLFLGVALSMRHIGAIRPGAAWPSEQRRLFYATVGWIVVALCLANTLLASIGFLALLALLALNEPIGIFVNAVQDVTKSQEEPPSAVVEEDPTGHI